MADKLRTWAARKLPTGHVVCEIVDHDEWRGDVFGSQTGDTRVYAAAIWNPGHRLKQLRHPNRSTDHTSDSCGPDSPCGGCYEEARQWWEKTEADRRGANIAPRITERM